MKSIAILFSLVPLLALGDGAEDFAGLKDLAALGRALQQRIQGSPDWPE